MMGDLSKYFSRKEMACKCGCGFDTVAPELVKALEWVRSLFPGHAVVINCACRCAKHNRKVGGAPNSFHMKGMAADFEVTGITPSLVQKRIDKEGWRGGLEYAKTWTHIDVGPQRRFKP
jgi:uncharacterized protein YcbK (DUF882 family)